MRRGEHASPGQGRGEEPEGRGELGERAVRLARARQREGRILRLSLAVAVGIHVVAFALFPRLQFSVADDPRFGPEAERRFVLAGVRVDLLFGPPRIRLPEGGVAEEPPERVLETRNLGLAELEVTLPCAGSFTAGSAAWEGSVHLRVRGSGLVSVEGIGTSTGDPCVDQALLAAAGALWYRWLPSPAYPAPVILEQPMRLQLAEELTPPENPLR